MQKYIYHFDIPTPRNSLYQHQHYTNLCYQHKDGYVKLEMSVNKGYQPL